MRENLGRDASEKHRVLLLNNLGKFLIMDKREKVATEVLESARDKVEKLAENDEPNVCKTKVYAYWLYCVRFGRKLFRCCKLR